MLTRNQKRETSEIDQGSFHLSNHLSNNDLPTLDTLPSTQHFVKRLANDVGHSPSPKTLAITGYWGSGKTSALAQLYLELTNAVPPGFKKPSIESESQDKQENPYHLGIWFEAWRYQHESVPIVALLHCIKAHFSTTHRFIDKAGKLASVSFLGALTVLDGVIKAATGMSGIHKVQAIGEKYEKDNLLSRLSSDQINDALKQAIDVILKENEQEGKKLIIFIDDLDRCEPETAYNLLEGIKIYLNIPNCTVVMAIDQEQIESSLKNKIGDNGFYGVEYLEKLFQDAHRLPIPSTEERRTFLIDQIKPLINLEKPGLQNHILALQSILGKYDCLPANPRRLKMLSNRLAALFRSVRPDEIGELQKVKSENQDLIYAIAILVVGYLSVSYRRLYERLESNPKFIHELFEFSNGELNASDREKTLSVFYEFDEIGKQAKTPVEHPSGLGVFRLKEVFVRGEKSISKQYEFEESALGDMMHQLIRRFNYPSENQSDSDNSGK